MTILRFSQAQQVIDNQLDLAAQLLGYELSFSRFGNSGAIIFDDYETSPSRVQQALRIIAACHPGEFSALMDQYVDIIKNAKPESIYLTSRDVFKLDPLAESHIIREKFENLSEVEWKSFLVALSATDQLLLTPPDFASAHELLDRHSRTFANKDSETGLALLQRLYCSRLENALLSNPEGVAKAINRFFSRLGEPKLSSQKSSWLDRFLELGFKGADLPTVSLRALLTDEVLSQDKYLVFIESVFSSVNRRTQQEKLATQKLLEDLAQNGEQIRRGRAQPKGTSTHARDGISSRLSSPDEPG